MDNWINTNINDEEKFLNEIREMFTINYINKNQPSQKSFRYLYYVRELYKKIKRL